MELATDATEAPSALEQDQNLWRRSLDGDGQAFGHLFDRHRARVYRHACRLTDTRHDAEDVVASAFLELWRRRDAVRLVDGSALPWLLVTTTNLSRNVARGTRRYRGLLERLPRALDAPDTAELALGTHALGADARLRLGLRSLKQVDAQLFALVALEGYSVGDAAIALGLSESAARTRLHRARARLRAQFDDGLPGSGSDDLGGGR